MLETASLTDTDHATPAAAAHHAPLATIVYRSRAVVPLSTLELLDLTQASQARNSQEAITGLMLYDQARFFQWLEGPADGIDRIMRSIQGDTRHTELDVLHIETPRARAFGDWAMKLALLGHQSNAWLSDIVEPPRDIVETLHQRPEAAPALFARLVPADMPPSASMLADSHDARPPPETASVLKTLILSSVLPLLRQRHQVPDPTADGWLPNRRAAELAQLLVEPDQAAALALIRELRRNDRSVSKLHATLFEQAARHLGDLWSEDLCSGLDVSIGLCRLQAAARLMSIETPRAIPRGIAPAVLIVPMPGELHQLGAMLDADALWHAGWNPRREYPANDQALQELVSDAWIDVLDLSLSISLRREDCLPRVAKLIAAARAASRNPALLVVVGGRSFAEAGRSHTDVGADLESRTSLYLDRLITRGLTQREERGRARAG